LLKVQETVLRKTTERDMKLERFRRTRRRRTRNINDTIDTANLGQRMEEMYHYCEKNNLKVRVFDTLCIGAPWVGTLRKVDLVNHTAQNYFDSKTLKKLLRVKK